MLAFQDELESDLSRFHRVDDFRVMDAGRFLRLAEQIAVYQGAVFLALSQHVKPQTAQLGTPDDSEDSGPVLNSEAAAIAHRRQFMQTVTESPIEWVSEDEILKEMGAAGYG